MMTQSTFVSLMLNRRFIQIDDIIVLGFVTRSKNNADVFYDDDTRKMS